MFLNLDKKPSLLSLPPELWRLIAIELTDDVASLNAFLQLNYEAFAISTPLLYQDVDRPEALGTLALPSSARFGNNISVYQNRHTAVHPASFVKTLKFDFRGPEYEECEGMSQSLHMKLKKAFANFAKHAARRPNDMDVDESNAPRVEKVPALTEFNLIFPNSPFFDIFEGIDFQPFQFRELDIRCLAPSPTMEVDDVVRWGSFLATMFKPSLEHLIFSIGNGTPSLASSYSAVIFRQIAQSAVRLQELHLCIPMPLDNESDERIVSNLNSVFHSNDFSFRNLRSCTIIVNWFLHAPPDSGLDLAPFLLRHPNLDYLAFYIISGNNLIRGPLSKGDLSRLTFCKSGPEDWLAICNPSIAPVPKLEHLELVLVDSIQEELEEQVVETFQCIATSLYALCISGHDTIIHDEGPRWLDFSFSHISIYEDIFKACTRLNYLECHVNLDILEAGFLALVIKHLPKLNSLTLAITDDRQSCSVSKAEEVLYKIWDELHNSSALRLLKLPTCAVDYYFHAEDSHLGSKVFTQLGFSEARRPRIVSLEYQSLGDVVA
ncbi:hypothetical protein BDP27DRAFT_1425970 [Rhodocollybia butyracea]|uniref:Uncharacterized protein n=1 Tax=Rhodocollybia butyracea TaxID=206335 RepID=A0A9P5PFH9_9AGAR|nr:hypothetical protein BDP27DRAFT_1425970 [Rhodocollybia butyracea]